MFHPNRLFSYVFLHIGFAILPKNCLTIESAPVGWFWIPTFLLTIQSAYFFHLVLFDVLQIVLCKFCRERGQYTKAEKQLQKYKVCKFEPIGSCRNPSS